MTSARTVARVGVSTALLSVLAGCSSDTKGDALSLTAPISVAPSAATPTAATSTSAGATAISTSRNRTAPGDSIFGGSAPVSIANWWAKHPDSAPSDLAERALLFNQKGTGPSRFFGPDLRKYDKVMMIITCSGTFEYSLRLQVLDGLSIATTAGDSCDGPNLSSYVTPSLTVVEAKTEVEVEVPAGEQYYVTLYGID